MMKVRYSEHSGQAGPGKYRGDEGEGGFSGGKQEKKRVSIAEKVAHQKQLMNMRDGQSASVTYKEGEGTRGRSQKHLKTGTRG